MRRIAVLTSGGDAPGMNAAIRAVVRVGIDRNYEVYGVEHGYTGLIAGEFTRLGARDVGGIIDRGGTILGTTRCEALRTPEGQRVAVERMRASDVDALIVIGGNGSQSGADALSRLGAKIVGVASTIDNDLAGTDISIGATTALDVALEAIDRLRVTASSHKRAFIIELMGRDCGYLALCAGVAGGAEAIVVPEDETAPEAVAAEINDTYRRGKRHAIIVVAEGARHGAESLANHCRQHAEHLGFDIRVSRLGHIQRGGTPGAFDRMLATRFGAAAVDLLDRGETGRLVGMIGGRVTSTAYADLANRPREFDRELFELSRVLSR